MSTILPTKCFFHFIYSLFVSKGSPWFLYSSSRSSATALGVGYIFWQHLKSIFWRFFFVFGMTHNTEAFQAFVVVGSLPVRKILALLGYLASV